jgi:hypothetical protein
MDEHQHQHQQPPQPKQPEQTDRQKRIAERQAQLKSRMPKAHTVRVEPSSDVLRRAVRHPRGIGFPPTGAAEWPLDRFTKRRIADGTVKVAGGDAKGADAPKAAPPPAPKPAA